MKQLNQMSILTRLFFVICLTGILSAEGFRVSEGAELASFAQDVYRQRGIDMPRSNFALENSETWGRIFVIRLLSRQSTLSDDLLQAFLVGGAVSQHAISPISRIIVVSDIEFSVRESLILSASGDCCEKLYNNRMTSDVFTQDCLRMQ